MSSDAGRDAQPLTAVGRVEPHPPQGFVVRRDDYGAFRSVESGTNELVLFRCTRAGLSLERREGRELIPWAAIEGLTLTFTDAGRARVPTVRVLLAAGPPLDYADALAPGADELPLALGPGQNQLLRVERCRMLTALIASAAGLAPATTRDFARGERGIAVPPLATRPRMLPRWAPPVLLAASIAAVALLTDVGWAGAVAVMAIISLHELGHAAAMRILGLRVRGIIFVPLLGAGTVPEHGFATRWDEARIALAGPVTGLPIAGALAVLLASGVAGSRGDEVIVASIAWALGVNILNLFPMLPLDGGRVLGCLTASAPGALRAIAAFAPITVLAVLVLRLAEGSALLAAAVFLGVCVALTRTTLRRQSFHGWMTSLPQPLAAVRASLRDVTNAFTGRPRDDVDGGVAPTPLTAPQTVGVLGVYAAEVIALVVAAVWFLEAVPGVFEFAGAGR